MKPPAYTPPYDSPLENDFAYQVVKYLDESADLLAQYHIDTLCGHFIVDFVAISQAGHRVGFECDGKMYHDKSRDEWRDAMIIGSEALDVIYRLRGGDLAFYLDTVLFLLSRCEPDLFSVRGQANLMGLAHHDAREFEDRPEKTNFRLALRNEESGAVSHLHIERRHNIIPPGRRQFWQAAYKFAVSHGGGALDDVIAEYRRGGT